MAVFLTLLFLFFQTTFFGPDFPVYPAYLLSIFQDGDLNLLNNLQPVDGSIPCRDFFSGLEATKTFNVPDFHNHGSVLFWIPFYLYGQAMAELISLFTQTDDPGLAIHLTVIATSFSTVALAYLACLLTYLLTARYFSPRLAFWSTMLLFWGSPAFYYTLVETGNANIPALFLSVLLILATASALTSGGWLRPLLLGLLFAICITVKLDLWFMLLFIAGASCYFLMTGQLRVPALFFFGGGFISASLLKLGNDYLKYGTLHSGESGLLNFHNSYHLEQLFSPYQGYFYSSPVLLFCLGALLFMARHLSTADSARPVLQAPQWHLDRLLLLMAACLFAKIFIVGFRFAWGGGTFGARQLLTELPFFTLMLAYLNQSLFTGSPLWRRLAWFLFLLVAVLLNLLHAGEYLGDNDMAYYLDPPDWTTRLAQLSNLLIPLQSGLENLPGKLSCLPLYALLLWLTRLLLARQSNITGILAPWSGTAGSETSRSSGNTFWRWMAGLSIFLVTAYSLLTLANAINNRTNVEEMANRGCLDQVVIVPRGQLEKRETLESMAEMLHYFTLKGDTREVARIETIMGKMYPGP